MNIRQKQWQLYYLGFLQEQRELDGIWGERSAEATRRFQRCFEIGVDGIFGPNTQAKSREAVAAIQRIVADYGEGKLAVDGLAGPATMGATLAYQRAWGLTATGIADQSTREHMGSSTGPGERETPQVEDWWEDIHYFTAEEFRCKCGRYCDGVPARMRRDVVRIADAARAHFGRPGYVVSGLRCQKHNANVGGVVNSQHMYGEAVDLGIEGISADLLLEFIQKQRGVRYAYKINETNVHFDIPKGAG